MRGEIKRYSHKIPTSSAVEVVCLSYMPWGYYWLSHFECLVFAIKNTDRTEIQIS